jgi:hypothetical protein
MCQETLYFRRCGCDTDLPPPAQLVTPNCNQRVFTRACTEYMVRECRLEIDGAICRACITWQALPNRPSEALIEEERKFYAELEKRLPEVERQNKERAKALKISHERKFERKERLENLEREILSARNKLAATDVGWAFYERERTDHPPEGRRMQ